MGSDDDLLPRVIPCLLLSRGRLVKTVQFADPRYVGDPINAVRIFNTKEVDEIAILDISATLDNTGPSFELLDHIADEAFVPLAYGGGITHAEQAERLLASGFEKVILNTSAFDNPALISDTAKLIGSQSVVVSIDVRPSPSGGYAAFTASGTRATGIDPVQAAKRAASSGAGEILLTSIERDGTQAGYDIGLIESVSAAVQVPVIASGGAGSRTDWVTAVRHGASAVAVGSMFVFHGKHRAVLITYPDYDVLEQLFRSEEQSMSEPGPSARN